MTKHNNAVRRQDDSGRGLGVLVLIAILTVVGIAIWLIVNGDD